MSELEPDSISNNTKSDENPEPEEDISWSVEEQREEPEANFDFQSPATGISSNCETEAHGVTEGDDVKTDSKALSSGLDGETGHVTNESHIAVEKESNECVDNSKVFDDEQEEEEAAAESESDLRSTEEKNMLSPSEEVGCTSMESDEATRFEVHNGYELQNNSNRNAEISGTDDNVCESEQQINSLQSFTGNVQIDKSSGSDAPEDELGNDCMCSANCDEESYCLSGSPNADNSDYHDSSSPNLTIQSTCQVADSHFERDSQAPECDRNMSDAFPCETELIPVPKEEIPSNDSNIENPVNGSECDNGGEEFAPCGTNNADSYECLQSDASKPTFDGVDQNVAPGISTPETNSEILQDSGLPSATNEINEQSVTEVPIQPSDSDVEKTNGAISHEDAGDFSSSHICEDNLPQICLDSETNGSETNKEQHNADVVSTQNKLSSTLQETCENKVPQSCQEDSTVISNARLAHSFHKDSSQPESQGGQAIDSVEIKDVSNDGTPSTLSEPDQLGISLEKCGAVHDNQMAPSQNDTEQDVPDQPCLEQTLSSILPSKVSASAESLVLSSESEGISVEYGTGSSLFEPAINTIIDSNDIERQVAEALQSDDDSDELMSELDEALINSASLQSHLVDVRHSSKKTEYAMNSQDTSSVGDATESDLSKNGVKTSNLLQLQQHNRQLLSQIGIRDDEISRLKRDKVALEDSVTQMQREREHSSNGDDLYLPQIKALERTIANQQQEIRATKDKLAAHDNAAKRAVTTLQNELKARVDQVTKMYEECVKEKDMSVVKFAASEAKVLEVGRWADKLEGRLKEVLKEKDSLLTTAKTAKADKDRVVANYEQKCSELSNMQKEFEKMREAVSSGEYRIRWFQNKLKDELEAHKETKSNLEKTNSKLKEAKEETEIIRRECQAIVKTYQESEEIKSNSLDKELKIKESELKLQMQERNDTEEIHQLIKRELESLKAQHKDTISEIIVLRDKVRCLDDELFQKEQTLKKSQDTVASLNRMNTSMTEKTNAFDCLQEDYSRAQEMITNLDKDVSELKLCNQDLQRDMESCSERETKMLALQSELSKTNAFLRSENTTLSNKASNLTGEVEKMRMELQELDTIVKDLSDKCEEEKKKRKEETDRLQASLNEKLKENKDFKQKWEDEVDNNKTLKRRHANNIKDLTRQLHQVKRRLDVVDGGNKDGNMGSRCNSSNSLNSVDNTHHGHQGQQATQPQQEHPVITEQVEVDKQVLIERIVRLQKAHARKNEKLEFLGEHIQQLLGEIKKKNKIIQSYIVREEAGTLSSEDMDANKSLLARKGGIMASVYSLHQQDGHMTLELSLQINKKLQAVLEDCLLKNITLKENLDTLGEEIARLSQENRKLQLHLQEISNRQ